MNHLTRNVANLVKKETAEFCQVEISEMFVETNIKKASYQFIETLRFDKKKKKNTLNEKFKIFISNNEITLFI